MHRALKRFLLKNEKIAVVGTGAVGSAIKNSLDEYSRKISFSVDYFNSKNIDEIFSKEYDLLIYAGVKAFKGLADSQPDLDKLHILKAADTFNKIKAQDKILISTIDAALDDRYRSAYGRNRRLLEVKVLDENRNAQVLRLPALFGSTVVKNSWHDMIIGPENVQLTEDLRRALEEENGHSVKEINIVSRVSDDSMFIWFNLDTIIEAIYDLTNSSDQIRMYASYDSEYREGIYLSQLDLKRLLNFENIGESIYAKRIDYTPTLTKQRLSFIKSETPINSSYWKGVVK